MKMKTLNTPQVADRLGISPWGVRDLIKRGRLSTANSRTPGERFFAEFYIDEVEKFADEYRPNRRTTAVMRREKEIEMEEKKDHPITEASNLEKLMRSILEPVIERLDKLERSPATGTRKKKEKKEKEKRKSPKARYGKSYEKMTPEDCYIEVEARLSSIGTKFKNFSVSMLEEEAFGEVEDRDYDTKDFCLKAWQAEDLLDVDMDILTKAAKHQTGKRFPINLGDKQNSLYYGSRAFPELWKFYCISKILNQLHGKRWSKLWVMLPDPSRGNGRKGKSVPIADCRFDESKALKLYSRLKKEK